MKLTSGEEFVLKCVGRQIGMSAFEIGRAYCTNYDNRWASPQLRVLQNMGLVYADRTVRPWRYYPTAAGRAEVKRRAR